MGSLQGLKLSLLKVEFPEKFNKIFTPSRYKGYFGGRGSGKSHSVARALLVLGTSKPLRILCTREFQNSLSDSVLQLLEDIINEYSLGDFYTVLKTEIVGRNGTHIGFQGLHRNIQKIKSYEGVDICWCEEAHNMTQKSFDVLIPTIRKEGSEIWFTWNPEESAAPIESFFKFQTDVILEKVNYYDNPFFPEVLRKEMENLKNYDYDKYLHVYEGDYLEITEAQVFKGKFTVTSFETPEDAVFYHGADWGFAKDPTTGIRCYISDNNLYIDKEVYGLAVEVDNLPEMFRRIETFEKWPSIGDSARPELISYLKNRGFNIKRSRKGKGSIEAGVERIRSFDKIFIHEKCVNTIYEFKNYSYKQDKLTGNILPVILDLDNHMIDALRYAIEDLTFRHKRKRNSSSAADALFAR